MFDPLSNFKLNKIKKGVDSVKAAVDALPTSLSSSFTDVKNAISGVSTKVDGVSADVTYLLPATAGSTLIRYFNKGVAGSKVSIYNVSGRGRLLYVLATLRNTKRLLITIDGKTYTLTNKAGVDAIYFVGNSRSPYFVVSPNTSQLEKMDLDIFGLRTTISNSHFEIKKKDMLSFSGAGFNNGDPNTGTPITRFSESRTEPIAFLAEDIVFNESLTIELDSGSDNATYTVAGFIAVSLFD